VRPLTTTVISDAASFQAMQPEWDALVLASPRPTPFLLHGWLAAWWTVYRPNLPMRCLTVRDDGRLVGALPLAVTRRGPVRVAVIAGARALGGDAIVAGADPHAVGAALTAVLQDEPLDVLDFDGVARDAVVTTCLSGPRRLIEVMAAPTMEMPDGWEPAYERTAGSSTRRTNRRRLKQLQEQGAVAFVQHATAEEVAGALEDAFRLHAIRWEGRGDTSEFGTTAGQTFHRAALAALAPGGYVRLLELRLDDTPIAFQLYFVVGGTVFTYRVAFDPAYARFSPGALTVVEALRQGGAEGATRVEFLRGDEPYKLGLADRADILLRLVGLPHGIRGRAYMETAAATTAARVRLRRNERLRHVVRRVRAVAHRQAQRPQDG
jgi:CelD/BcsL family acetyltransferase involved in cellulose biosynthesis